MPGWAEEQTPTPFLYICGNLKLWINCRLWGVWEVCFCIMAIKTFIKDNRNNLEVPLDYNDNEELLRCLFDSIFDVDKGYIFYRKKNEGPDYPQTERVFAYEFYRKWATNVEERNTEYIVNGEPAKEVSSFRNTQYQYPDLVLHHNQGDAIHQGIVCEIKRKKGLTTLNFEDDIKKLYHFACNKRCKYKFQFGVFILVGTKMDAIVDIILKTNNELLSFNKNNRKTNNIICVTYDGNVLEFCQLHELVSKSPEEMKAIIEEYRNNR